MEVVSFLQIVMLVKQLPTLVDVYSGAFNRVLTYWIMTIFKQASCNLGFCFLSSDKLEEAVNFPSEGDVVSFQDISAILQKSE